MGNLLSKAKATNEVNNLINLGVDVYNTTVQNCSTAINNVNDITIISEGNNNNIDVTNITQRQTVNLDSDCVSKAITDTTIKQDVINKMVQDAAATVGALSIGSSEANNIINNTYNLSQKVIDTFEQKCSPSVDNSNNIKFTSKGDNNKIYIAYLSQEQIVKVTTKCIQDTLATSDLAQSLEQDLSQTASAKNEGLLDFLKWIAIAIIGIIGIIVIIIIAVIIAKAVSGKGKTEVMIPKESK